jgi:hypothetical protein
LNRFTAKLKHRLARLAFWRKPAAPIPEQPETSDPETARDLKAVEAELSADADTLALPVGWFARMKQGLRRQRSPVQDPDQSGATAPPSRDDASATADAAPTPQPAFLARLKSMLRRQPRLEQPEAVAVADDPKPGTEEIREAAASGDAEPTGDEEAVHVSRFRRVLAMFSNKWVWIPGVSAVLLALIGTMLLMLQQSAQEKEALQAELLATRNKLEQTTGTKKAAASLSVAGQADATTFARAGSAAAETGPGVDAGDCLITDKASVTQNLKNCIDSFNNATIR